MEITIFKGITTEGVIASIEENSEKYHVGFYADMNNAPERKLVKESASEIGGIIKELEAARIKITKANTAAVNKEHKLILERLVIANAPFQTLIDEYAAQRKKILADEKRVVELRAAMVQKEDDHEMGLLMDEKFDNDILTAERDKLEYEAKLKDQAVLEIQQQNEALVAQQKQAVIDADLAKIKSEWLAIELEAYKINDDIDAEIQRDYLAGVAEVKRLASIETERLAGIDRQRVAQQAIDDEAARKLADVNHVRTINRAVYKSFIDAGLTIDCATLATQALIDNKVSHTIINY